MKIKSLFPKIALKKINTRGDEVGILLFALSFMIFLLFSAFRLFAIGKFCDDFIFLLLFGWLKYLVYFLSIIFTLPLFFNYYFKIKLRQIGHFFLFVFISSWLVNNIFLIVNNNDIWYQRQSFGVSGISNFVQVWWNHNIINNYYGFFSQPISFAAWNDVASFFPNWIVGGLFANIVISLLSYGTFLTNFIISIIVLITCLAWWLFAKPELFWLICLSISRKIKYSYINFYRRMKRKKANKQNSEPLLAQPQAPATSEPEPKKNIFESTPPLTKETINMMPIKTETVKVKKVDSSKVKTFNLDDFQENNNLTPFGPLTKDENNKTDIE